MLTNEQLNSANKSNEQLAADKGALTERLGSCELSLRQQQMQASDQFEVLPSEEDVENGAKDVFLGG